MQSINKNSAGLTVGLLFGLAHLVWAILVALNWAKNLVDWILGLHFMTLSYSIGDFNLGTAVLLVAVTYAVGYIFGWVAAALWNMLRK